MLLDFIAKAFKALFSFFAWVAMVLVAIAGVFVLSFNPLLSLAIWVIGLFVIISAGGLISIFMSMDANLKGIRELLENGSVMGEKDKSKLKDEVQQLVPVKTDFKADVSYKVIKEIYLHDSLGLDAKKKRLLGIGERVKVNNVLENFNKGWAYIETESNEEGWCLFDFLEEIK